MPTSCVATRWRDRSIIPPSLSRTTTLTSDTVRKRWLASGRLHVASTRRTRLHVGALTVEIGSRDTVFLVSAQFAAVDAMAAALSTQMKEGIGVTLDPELVRADPSSYAGRFLSAGQLCFCRQTTMSHPADAIRYLPEKYFRSPTPILLASLSPSSRLVALSKGPRITINPVAAPSHPTSPLRFLGHQEDGNFNRDAGLPVYIQDGNSEVTALMWLTDAVFVAGHVDGTVVITEIIVGQTRVHGHSFGVRASSNRIQSFLTDSSKSHLVVATQDTVQLWKLSRSLALSYERHTHRKVDNPILSWSPRSFKSLYMAGANDIAVCVSWNGCHRVSATQSDVDCVFTYTNAKTGDETTYTFPTPGIIDREFRASFLHDDKLVLLASSHKVVLWDIAFSELAVQEMRHISEKHPQSHLAAVSVGRRVEFWNIIYVFVTVRGPEAVVWEAVLCRQRANFIAVCVFGLCVTICGAVSAIVSRYI
ncbi:hypothetical protein BDZ89DRAFT_1046806 [Hymenopellis radicata]|nr:hypothetical protein BDZ89DRAFT_1046806 [Hymenopellis radicata]